MAVRVLDLRQQPERCAFMNSSDDSIRYAEAFWQSVRLQPAMESRLVSSDIKQRLAKRHVPKQCTCSDQAASESDRKLQELFVRARTLDQIERFEHLRKLAEARIQDRNMLHRRREERIKKEQISRNKVPKPITCEDIAKVKELEERKIGKAYTIEEMIREIDNFEKKKHDEYKKLERAAQIIKEHNELQNAAKDTPCITPEITVRISTMDE